MSIEITVKHAVVTVTRDNDKFTRGYVEPVVVMPIQGKLSSDDFIPMQSRNG